MFLYVAFPEVHTPLQVPQKFLDMYPTIDNVPRKKLSGKLLFFANFFHLNSLSAMVSAMDFAVGQIVASLKAFNIYDNSIIVFTSDVSAKRNFMAQIIRKIMKIVVSTGSFGYPSGFVALEDTI